jgi:hypothetical protein
MSVHDPHVWSKYGRSGAEAEDADGRNALMRLRRPSAVANFDTRSARGDVASPKDVIARVPEVLPRPRCRSPSDRRGLG